MALSHGANNRIKYSHVDNNQVNDRQEQLWDFSGFKRWNFQN